MMTTTILVSTLLIASGPLASAADDSLTPISIEIDAPVAGAMSGDLLPDGTPTWTARWHPIDVQGPAPGYRPLVAWVLFLTNNGEDPLDYSLIVRHPLEVNIRMPLTMRGQVDTSIEDGGGQGNATLQNIQSPQFAGDPLFAAYVDGVDQPPQMTLLEAPYELTVNEPGGTAADEARLKAVPGPPAGDELAIWLKISISPATTVEFLAEFEVTPCPSDCSPVSEEGIIGDGRVDIDDLLTLIVEFGTEDPACDPAPELDPWTFGNNQVDVDDLLATINAFGPCPTMN